MARKVTRSKGQVHAVVAAAAILGLLLIALSFYRPGAALKPEEMLRQALLHLEQAHDYSLVIEEKGSGYTLTFEGQVESGAIINGTLPDYDLEVFHVGDDLHVRKTGSEQWEEARELKSLPGFLISPAKLLRAQKLNFKNAAAGQNVELNGRSCRTVYLDLTGEQQFMKMLFPQIETDAIEKASLGAAFDDEEQNLIQLRLLVEFADGGRLERAYHLQ